MHKIHIQSLSIDGEEVWIINKDAVYYAENYTRQEAIDTYMRQIYDKTHTRFRFCMYHGCLHCNISFSHIFTFIVLATTIYFFTRVIG